MLQVVMNLLHPNQANLWHPARLISPSNNERSFRRAGSVRAAAAYNLPILFKRLATVSSVYGKNKYNI